MNFGDKQGEKRWRSYVTSQECNNRKNHFVTRAIRVYIYSLGNYLFILMILLQYCSSIGNFLTKIPIFIY